VRSRTEQPSLCGREEALAGMMRPSSAGSDMLGRDPGPASLRGGAESGGAFDSAIVSGQHYGPGVPQQTPEPLYRSGATHVRMA